MPTLVNLKFKEIWISVGPRLKKNAQFKNSTIGGKANFRGTKIGELAVFEGTKFQGDADFEAAEIKLEVKFKDAKFKKPKAQEECCRISKQYYENKGNRKKAKAFSMENEKLAISSLKWNEK